MLSVEEINSKVRLYEEELSSKTAPSSFILEKLIRRTTLKYGFDVKRQDKKLPSDSDNTFVCIHKKCTLSISYDKQEDSSESLGGKK